MGRRNNGNRATDSLNQRNRDQSDTYYNRVNERFPGATERADENYNAIFDRANAGANANYNPNDFESYGIFRNMTGPQGGLDPSRVSSIDQNIAGFKRIGADGGWSTQDIADSKLQASRVPTSIFAGLAQRDNQRRNITGGYAPGASGDMGRQAARAAAEGVLDSDIARSADIRGGKLAGLAGAQGAEMQLMDLITGQQRFGASGMQGGEGMALDATQRENQAGLSSLLSLYNSSPGELDALFGQDLQGRQLDNSTTGNIVQREDQQDAARRDRKIRAANSISSAGTTAATAGAGAPTSGGTSGPGFMHKPRR